MGHSLAMTAANVAPTNETQCMTEPSHFISAVDCYQHMDRLASGRASSPQPTCERRRQGCG